MSKVQNYLKYIEDGLKLQDGSPLEVEKRLFKIWARLSEYLYYSETSFEKFMREMGYSEYNDIDEDEFDLNIQDEDEEEDDEEEDADEESEKEDLN